MRNSRTDPPPTIIADITRERNYFHGLNPQILLDTLRQTEGVAPDSVSASVRMYYYDDTIQLIIIVYVIEWFPILIELEQLVEL